MGRNKTMDLSPGEREELRRRLGPGVGVICGKWEEVAPGLGGLGGLGGLEVGEVGCALVDPPYNRRMVYEGVVWEGVGAEEYVEWFRRGLEEVVRMVRGGGAVYVFSDWQNSLLVSRVFEEVGLVVRNKIVWGRGKGRGSKTNWKNNYEEIWYCVKPPLSKAVFNWEAVRVRKKVVAPYKVGGVARDWSEGEGGRWRWTGASNFWDGEVVPFWSMAENTRHPCQKSESLMEKLVLASSMEGDIVLDPYCGVGSGLVAAAKCGRRWLGVEREEYYCCLALKRLEDATSKLSKL